SITKSSRQREALPAGIVHETEYIRDDAYWLDNGNAVRNSMRDFYKKTGVQPYLWITEEINGSRDASWDEIQASMEEVYLNTFSDEGHLILLFYEPYENEYKTAYLAGSAAKTVIDDEAAEIILDCFDYYYYGDMTDNEYFAAVFDKSAGRIMTVTKNIYVVVALIFAGLVLLFVLYKIIAMLIKQKNVKRQQDIDILNADTSKINEDEAAKLADKYKEDQEV
ncbi:MAG: hypothetical protein LBT34_01560, partial [Clostridiales Family XIII bacterium]|nr:hypothetical protein [Clostridiales Family XIII bacterium]